MDDEDENLDQVIENQEYDDDGDVALASSDDNNTEGEESSDENVNEVQQPARQAGFFAHLPAVWRNRQHLVPAYLRRLWRGRRNHGNSNSDSDDDEVNENSEAPRDINFDRNLPTSHSYLGEMEECSGVSFQDQESYVSLSILYVHDFVLVPGQTLPLQINRLNEVSLIRNVMQQPDKTFGVLTTKYVLNEDHSYSRKKYDFGCTAEIRSFRDEEEFEISTLRIVAVGRQRFKVMDTHAQLDGNVLAKVKIVSDVELPNLNDSVGMCQKCKANLTAESESSPIETPLYHRFRRSWMRTRQTAFATSWPPWVYKMHDTDFLRMAVFAELKEWNQKLQERQCPDSATDFSFWVVTILPFSDERRLELLRLESAVQRLRCELQLLRECTVLTCSGCLRRIANREDVFSMSTSGPMAAYVNPGGVVHETLTLYKASGLSYVGNKSTEHSWFPGYAWTICECKVCRRHMGWKFTATKSDLKPQKFWGLTRSALLPKMAGADNKNSLTETTQLDSGALQYF